MFKDMNDPGEIRLFRKSCLRITWGHTGRAGYFPRSKAAFWQNFIDIVKEQHAPCRKPSHNNRSEHQPALKRDYHIEPGGGTDRVRQRSDQGL